MMSLKYSVVIPLKNEEENIGELIRELEPVMGELGQFWELICINDGSTDETLNILKELSSKKDFLKIISFPKSFGQSSAFDAGFKHARGEWVITMDGDCQNDPKDIPKLVEISENHDLICGQRTNRKDPWHKTVTSLLANAVRSRFCHDQIKDTGCSLKLYRRSCLQNIKMYHGMHRFLPALFKIEGYRVAEVPVNHRERTKGKTKYNFFNRSLNTIADMFAVRWMWKRRLHYQIEKKFP